MTGHVSENPDSYQTVIDVIRQHARHPITDKEAQDAARNLISYCRLALAIRRQKLHNVKHDTNY